MIRQATSIRQKSTTNDLVSVQAGTGTWDAQQDWRAEICSGPQAVSGDFSMTEMKSQRGIFLDGLQGQRMVAQTRMKQGNWEQCITLS